MSNPVESTNSSKAPSHAVYQVRDREGARSVFTRIGAAWPHKDGKGYNILLDGRLSLRVISEDK